MQFEVFINFDGNCREALEFYSKVFNKKINNVMTYSEAPPDPENPISEADKDKIMYAGLKFDNMVVMFMDIPSGMSLTKGSNITPTLNSTDKAEIERLFNELKEGGTVDQELEKTFFSELYGMVTDKYGIGWQLLYYLPGDEPPDEE